MSAEEAGSPVLVTAGRCAGPLSPEPGVGTDLPQHVRRDGERGPDGRVHPEEHEPEQHASPDGQVTELPKNRERSRVNTRHFLHSPSPGVFPCSGLCRSHSALSTALGFGPVAQVVQTA